MQPTQLQYPGRAVARTIVAFLVVAVPTYAIVVPMFLDSFKDYLPEGVAAWLAASVAFVGVLVGFVTRIMAIPVVNAALTAVGLGAAPTPTVAPEAPQVPSQPAQ